MRQPVGISVVNGSLIVVCSDESVWFGAPTHDQEHAVGTGVLRKVQWQQLSSVPGTSADSGS